MEKKYIDMHIHSNLSDGMFAPSNLVDFASSNKTKILSIADHDTINAIPKFRESLKADMYGINGVEFSSYIIIDDKRYKLHILGYAFDINNTSLNLLLNNYKEKRINSHQKFLYNLKQIVSEFPEEEINNLDIERYCWFDRDVIDCYKKTNSPNELIEYLINYSKIHRFSYGGDYEEDAKNVIDAIHSSLGYVVLAHPMAYGYDKEDVFKIIKKLKESGIDGIEVYQSDCSQLDSIWLRKLANKYHLLVSVGSDFHRNIESDGREISLGINNNLCIEETTLTDEIIRKRQYFKGKGGI